MELHLVKNDVRFSPGKRLVSLEKRKLLNQNLWETHGSLIDQRVEICLIDIVNTYTECFILKFLILFIVYIGAEHIKLCLASRARNLVLFCFYFSTTAIAENFCYSQCKIQETFSQCKTQEIVSLILIKKIWSCFEKKNEIHNWIIFDTWPDTYMKRYR